MRHLRIDHAATLDHPAVLALIEQSLAKARVPLPADEKARLVIRAISVKQRPRRPA